MYSFKNILIGVMAIALCIVYYVACNEHLQLAQQHSAATNNTTASIVLQPERTYKDDSGHIHTVAKNPTLTKEAVKNLIPFMDSVAEALDIKPKQIESITVVPTEMQAKEVAFLQKKIDSLKRQTYYYKDKYLQLAVRTGNDADTLDKGAFDFKYDADLTITQYAKRKKFLGLGLGAKQSYIDISSTDPRTTIMGVKKYTVMQKHPDWGLRIQAIQNYSFISNSANTGIRATFDLKHLSFTGGYYYNWNINQWRPSLSVGYDIIRF